MDYRPPIRFYWVLAGVALFLLIPADMVTTVLVVSKHGASAEANPLMKQFLGQGLFILTIVNISVGILASLMFWGFIRTVKEASGVPLWISARAYEIWVSALIISGFFTVMKNISLLTGLF